MKAVKFVVKHQQLAKIYFELFPVGKKNRQFLHSTQANLTVVVLRVDVFPRPALAIMACCPHYSLDRLPGRL